MCWIEFDTIPILELDTIPDIGFGYRISNVFNRVRYDINEQKRLVDTISIFDTHIEAFVQHLHKNTRIYS